jgi:hypothetical protein
MQEMLDVRREIVNYQRHEMDVHPDSPRLSRGLPTLKEAQRKKKASEASAENAAYLMRF